MKPIPIVLLCAALGASASASAADASADQRVLVEKRDIYVPVDRNGHMVGNEMIVVRKDTVLPPGSDAAWARARSDRGTTYVLVPDPKDSANAPAPRYYVYRTEARAP